MSAVYIEKHCKQSSIAECLFRFVFCMNELIAPTPTPDSLESKACLHHDEARFHRVFFLALVVSLLTLAMPIFFRSRLAPESALITNDNKKISLFSLWNGVSDKSSRFRQVKTQITEHTSERLAGPIIGRKMASCWLSAKQQSSLEVVMALKSSDHNGLCFELLRKRCHAHVEQWLRKATTDNEAQAISPLFASPAIHLPPTVTPAVSAAHTPLKAGKFIISRRKKVLLIIEALCATCTGSYITNNKIVRAAVISVTKYFEKFFRVHIHKSKKKRKKWKVVYLLNNFIIISLHASWFLRQQSSDTWWRCVSDVPSNHEQRAVTSDGSHASWRHTRTNQS